MKVNYNEYLFSHGKMPRGYGNWFFAVTGTDGNGRCRTEEISVIGTLDLARQSAIREFSRNNPDFKVTAVKIGA